MKKSWTVAIAVGMLLSGCTTGTAGDQRNESGNQPAATSTDLGPFHRPANQQPNAPIKELLTLNADGLGIHCFATGGDAVAAQLRASRAAEADNTKLDQQTDDKGRKPSPSNYLYVGDVGDGNFPADCYAVRTGGLH
ncbi:Uncharacterised protein [Mycobacteroides abscessus subsp. abscessus]|uniref:hypothetical protein n=1 Tax=Mycobacteroides abscessus TaxID=36809 RepID=UPI000926E88C|nr:hypothetical protein [Mycobacteroides abscessus]SIM15740.1 Uncharacterised protein [Mycobacteroides abscessus subsp. abscessus]